MDSMELELENMLNDPSLKYSSELASQDKMIIRIKKQEQGVDIYTKDSTLDHEEIVSYTCEIVQKVDETKSEFVELCDEPIESVRQDENFIYPPITNSDDEDTTDATWTPPSLNSGERGPRKHIRCLYPKVPKPLTDQKKRKISKPTKELTAKRLKKEHLQKTKPILNNLSESKLIDKMDSTVTATNEPKKACDSHTPKVCKPRKGMATPKQRLGRIIKIHKMMK
ncbi:lysine-specific demethylase phf2-like isoform X2 [Adelges cooleyi]|nr:lysine-specific demethylase phf2-like isoform X2 [Adelges cooleyi]XP_050438461.1 lysine-specific demethylase phf2-like isoform X2 [Adelges cooleyi]XP_050438462.1 lysine-specific demethylase phf2-like isoform X2 [Adelges cooleyi]XP_050438463.1 lysine-specific demethylase phf2-like isoform X2 [Adelges cooleyi]XP_050438464.1 lysine-specific demethylase phf2-like isoform X2 [Adelges cooleyi]